MKKIIAGVDEVGRGSLIGPVYAAAVILQKKVDKKLIKDSKKLSKKKREVLEKYIKKNSIWSIGSSSKKEIEKYNILEASMLAMKRAIKKLKYKPNIVLVDGNKKPKIKNYTETSATITEINPNEGDLLIFPAYLYHSVGENLSEDDRIIVSFNVDINN